MDLTLTTVVVLYEEHGLSAEEIAETKNLDVELVKAALESSSSAYRAAIKKGGADELVASAETLALIHQRLIDTALHSDDERLRTKVQMRLIDDKKGRLDKKAVVNIFPNFVEINARMRAIRAERSRAIEVESSPA